MYCIHCGQENQNSARFCMKCGKPISIPKQAPETQPTKRVMTVPVPAASRKDETLLVEEKPTQIQTKFFEHVKPEPQPATPTKVILKRKSVVRECCPICIRPVRSGIAFCESCGVYLSAMKLEVCPACGFTNRPGLVHCEDCGESLNANSVPGQTCPDCQFSNRLGVSFCENCGGPLQKQPDQSAIGSILSKLNLKKMLISFAWRQLVSRFLAGTVGGFLIGKIGMRLINYIF